MAKQLEWSEASSPNEKCPYDHASAETPFGEYLISWKSWKDYPEYSIEFMDKFITAESRLEDAKEAAQSDFDKRVDASCITSANTASPQQSPATRTHSSTPKLPP